MSAFAFVKVSLNAKSFGQRLALSYQQYVYDMSGFDSVGGGRVYWSSTGTPNTSPSVTSPALSGSLVYPHIIGRRVALP
jgi:hypothetical protein